MADSVDAIIAAFGGVSRFGAAIGTTPQAASNMRARGSIPAERWTRVVAEAVARGIPDVTLEALAAIAARPRGGPATDEKADEGSADSAPVPEELVKVNASDTAGVGK